MTTDQRRLQEIDALIRAGITAPTCEVRSGEITLSPFGVWVARHGRLPKPGEAPADWFEAGPQPNLPQRRFGSRVVLRLTRVRYGHQHGIVRCDCGDEREVDLYALVRGRGTKCQTCAAQERAQAEATERNRRLNAARRSKYQQAAERIKAEMAAKGAAA